LVKFKETAIFGSHTSSVVEEGGEKGEAGLCKIQYLQLKKKDSVKAKKKTENYRGIKGGWG